MVNNFTYDASIISALENAISPDRLTAYLAQTLGDKEKAFELYAWNTEISAELYAPLQGLEITLRNAVHRELSNVYGDTWYDNSQIPFNYVTLQKISHAKNLLNRKNVLDPPHMVAELSFGFWVTLLSHGGQGAYHDKLWIPALHKSFPNIKKKRKEVHKELGYLRKLRNRIAHHEPIFARHLSADYDTIIKIVGWMCADTATWVDHHNCFNEILARRP